MPTKATGKTMNRREPGSPPFKTIALLLQGGGALGAYQGGVYEALARANVLPNWIAGISIGAVNSALIAGNPPEKRVERLREFWEAVSTSPLGVFGIPYGRSLNLKDQATHQLRQPGPRARDRDARGAVVLRPALSAAAPLAAAETEHAEFLRRRAAESDARAPGRFRPDQQWRDVRFSVGAVNVSSGNFTYFDSTTHKIDARHIIASGSLPPGFPATEVDGEYYWDGGLVSNTPLQWVFDSRPRVDTLAFQVDLWSSSGELPRDLTQADVRQKEIQFASRTRFATDHFKLSQGLRHAFRRVYDRLPGGLRSDPDVEMLASETEEKAYNVVELIYRAKPYEGVAQDYEFSRRTMEEHWRTGHEDAARALAHPEIFQRADNLERFQSFDFSQKHDRRRWTGVRR